MSKILATIIRFFRHILSYIIQFIVCLCFFLTSPLYSENKAGKWIQSKEHNYHSALGDLEKKRFTSFPIYTSYQLQNFRKSSRPLYAKMIRSRREKLKEKAVHDGILFTYKNYQAKKVYLAGDFNHWSRIQMKRGNFGVHYFFLSLQQSDSEKKKQLYRYKFNVDNIWIEDPLNPYHTNGNSIGRVSLFHLEKIPVERTVSFRILKHKSRNSEKLVEFSIYLPKAKNLFLVGNFNNWNPEHDWMKRGEDGIFRRKVWLPHGSYIYKYIADGKWILDTYNPDTRFSPTIQELCSFIEIL